MATADMWFDPTCPWAWVTSRWLLEVERVRDVQVRFHIMSLSILNEDQPGQSDADREGVRLGWGPVRVAAATELAYGADALRHLYTSIGTLLHAGGSVIDRNLYGYALSRAGLPHSLANAAGTGYYDDTIRASHRAGVEPVGGEVGTPIVHLHPAPGQTAAFFGPVLTPAPKGEAAGRLWDGLALAAQTDGFFELKRIVNRSPAVD